MCSDTKLTVKTTARRRQMSANGRSALRWGSGGGTSDLRPRREAVRWLPASPPDPWYGHPGAPCREIPRLARARRNPGVPGPNKWRRRSPSCQKLPAGGPRLASRVRRMCSDMKLTVKTTATVSERSFDRPMGEWAGEPVAVTSIRQRLEALRASVAASVLGRSPRNAAAPDRNSRKGAVIDSRP